MAGSLRTYAAINARLRARLSRMLSADFIHQLERSRSLPECVQMLRDTSFGALAPIYNETGDIRMAELALHEEEIRLYLDLENMTRGVLHRFIAALVARFEIETLKNALRLWFDANVREHAISGAAGYLYRGRIHNALNLDGIVNAHDLQSVAAALADTPYRELVEASIEAVETRKSLFPIELALDCLYHENLSAAVDKLGSRDRNVAGRILGIEVDWQNVMWIMRVMRFYSDQPDKIDSGVIPGGLYISAAQLRDISSPDEADELLQEIVRRRYPALLSRMASTDSRGLYPRLAVLEELLAEILRIESRRALCGYPFTAGIILAYFILRGDETQRLVTILNSMAYGAPDAHMGVAS